jgi:hypothetical protein
MRKRDNEIPHDGGRSIPEWASLDACFLEIGPVIYITDQPKISTQDQHGA